jgi:hypothetical protein
MVFFGALSKGFGALSNYFRNSHRRVRVGWTLTMSWHVVSLSLRDAVFGREAGQTRTGLYHRADGPVRSPKQPPQRHHISSELATFEFDIVNVLLRPDTSSLGIVHDDDDDDDEYVALSVFSQLPVEGPSVSADERSCQGLPFKAQQRIPLTPLFEGKGDAGMTMTGKIQYKRRYR